MRKSIVCAKSKEKFQISILKTVDVAGSAKSCLRFADVAPPSHLL